MQKGLGDQVMAKHISNVLGTHCGWTRYNAVHFWTTHLKNLVTNNRMIHFGSLKSGCQNFWNPNQTKWNSEA